MFFCHLLNTTNIKGTKHDDIWYLRWEGYFVFRIEWRFLLSATSPHMVTCAFHPYHRIQLWISSNNKVLHLQRSHAIHGHNISYLQAILILLYQFPLLLVNFLFGNTCYYNNTWTVGVHSSSWFAFSLLTINFIYLPYLFLNTLHTHTKWNEITCQKKYKYVYFKEQQISD